MFAINFNFPYRKKDGSLITMEKALDGAGADLDLIDLDDVAITDLTDGDGLVYDATAEKWKNKSVAKVATVTGVNITSTAYTLQAATVRRVGNIVQVYFSINIPNGLAAGENADGIVSGLPLPLMNCQGNTYTGTRVVGWLIQPDGTVRIRAVDALLSNEYVAIAATYICE